MSNVSDNQPNDTVEQPKPTPEEIVEDKNKTISRAYLENHPFMEEKKDDSLHIPLPSDKVSVVNKSLGDASDDNGDREPSDQEIEWAKTIISSMDTSLSRDMLSSTAEDLNSEWHQSVDYKGYKLQGVTPTLKKNEGEELTGSKAILAVVSGLGLGSMYQVPLWHSGFWITLKPPSEGEVVELFRLLDASVISLGRMTGGLIYSNLSVITAKHVVEFIMEHIHSTTIDNWKNEDLYELIKVQDLFPLISGIAATMYTKGFTYKRACVVGPDKCNHVVKGRVDIRKLLFVNRSVLTDDQKNHMSFKRPKSVTVDDVKLYQRSLSNISGVRRKMDGDVDFEIELKSPSIKDYIEEGERWVEHIVSLVDDALTEEDKDKREEMINLHAESTLLRQYSQWIESLSIDGSIIIERNTLDVSLAAATGDNKIRKWITDMVLDYINTSTIAMIGVPAYDCPVCNTDQSDENAPEGFKTLIPLDTLSLFFFLVAQRRTHIALRQMN